MIISYHIFQSLQSQTVSMLAALAAKAKVANFRDSHLFLDVVNTMTRQGFMSQQWSRPVGRLKNNLGGQMCYCNLFICWCSKVR